jgi:hypothetical protein
MAGMVDGLVSPNRLLAAADTLLSAIHSGRGFNSLVLMYVGPHRVEGPLPSRVFTPEELMEAMDMLIRAGRVPVPMSRIGSQIHMSSLDRGTVRNAPNLLPRPKALGVAPAPRRPRAEVPSVQRKTP